MSNLPLISIIVPVYNAQKFLNRCVDSLISQTYENIEIILVNDGSKDDSGAICDSFAQKDSRVKVIHKENGGVSSARNLGLDTATGEYIAFVDADDYVDKDMYKKLYDNAVSTGSDISMCSYALEDKEGNIIDKSNNSELFEFTRSEMVKHMLMQKLYTCSPWNKLLKADTINNIRFDTHVLHNEDLLFIYQAMKNCNKAVFMDKPLYFYCYNENSAARVSYSDKNTTMLIAQDFVLSDIGEAMPDIYDVALTEYVKTMIFNLTAIAKGNYKNKEYIRKLKKAVRQNLSFFWKSYVAKGYKIYALVISVSFNLYKSIFCR